jgi:hypothetical protein
MTPAEKKYRQQMQNATSRSILFRLTFEQWWAIWQESGHWEERGRHGYVMARKGDVGVYEVGNVEIITVTQNARDHVRNANSDALAAERDHVYRLGKLHLLMSDSPAGDDARRWARPDLWRRPRRSKASVPQ